MFLDEEQAFVRSGDRAERLFRLLRDEVMNMQLCVEGFSPENKSP